MIKNLRVEPAIDVEFKRDTSFMEPRKESVLTGEQIREIRENKGMSQTDLARELRVGHQNVWNWEHGKNLCPKRYSDIIRSL